MPKPRAPKLPTKRKAAPSGPVADAVDVDAIMTGLFAHMAAGGSVRAYAATVGHDAALLRQWANTEKFASQYARAREVQADVDVEEALHVATQAAKGELDPNAARLLVDTLKWRAARFHRNRYGDKASVEVTGDAERPVEVRHRWRFGDQVVEF